MQILTILGYALPLATFIVTTIVALVKGKGKKAQLLVAKLVAMIPNKVSEAEKIFGNGNGQAKLSYVLQGLQMQALKEGFCVDEADLITQVENVITCTKEVNTVKIGEVSR